MFRISELAFGTPHAYCATLNHDVPESKRAALVEQITRDMQTLGQLRSLGYVAHPGELFYLDRIAAYQETLAELDNAGPGTGEKEIDEV